MKPALLVFCGAIAMAWLLPRPLGRQAPAAWLPATGGVVAARVRRLAGPPPPVRRVCHGLALAALTLAIVTIAALGPAFAATGMAG